MASLYPFLALYYAHLGLSGDQIGTLAAIPPLVSLFAASLWGALADLTQKYRYILRLAISGVIASALALSLTRTFLGLIPAVIAYACFMAPIIPLIDNAVLKLLGDQADRYGKVRLWGAVGWGVAAPLMGWLVEQFGLRWSFYGYAILMCGSLAASWYLPVARASIGGGFRRGLRALLRNRQWLFFLLIVFIGGMGQASVNNFLFLYLSDLGASKSVMGWALTIATASETTVLFFADRLLARWGAPKMLAFSLGATAVRLLAYSFARVPWLALLIQLLHGPTFAVMWAAGVSYANRSAPVGLGATALGLFSSANFGVGAAAGAFACGLLYERLGSLLMFRWMGLWGLFGLVLLVAIGLRQPRPASAV
jgi:PPP family 3-phenylpropionic acid transporter